MIAIITLHEDLHALEVKRAARRLGYDDLHIIEVDRVSECAPVGIRIAQNDKKNASSYLTASDGTAIDLAKVATIWLRRPRAAQLFETSASSAKEIEFINNECQAYLTSVRSSRAFHGRWVSDPEATARACDKIFQLQVALKCGFRVPATLVSQSRTEVIGFHEACERKVIRADLSGYLARFLIDCAESPSC